LSKCDFFEELVCLQVSKCVDVKQLNKLDELLKFKKVAKNEVVAKLNELMKEDEEKVKGGAKPNEKLIKKNKFFLKLFEKTEVKK
jgi:hypothetical protein